MENKPKNLELDRLVFFSDAVVAIAITLLALDLKLDLRDGDPLTFAAVGHAWKRFFAFLLSFVYVGVFWINHHRFFMYIRAIDGALLWYNLGWLLFIVTLPFSTSLMSAHLPSTTAAVIYCANTLMITFFQNQIWDHAAVRPAMLKEPTDPSIIYAYRLTCNVAMINALLAIAMSFLSPLAAYGTLMLRLPMMWASRKMFKYAPEARH
jgi:uncharacterized membrane protein